MRRFLLFCCIVMLGILLVACNTESSPLPTVAQFPTDNAADPMVTDTPGGEGLPGGDGGADEATEEPPPAFASPTPEILDPGSGGGSVACTAPDVNTLITSADIATLQAELAPLVANVRNAGQTLNGWTLNESPDPMMLQMAESLGEELATEGLVYGGPNGEQAVFVIIRLPDEAIDYWRDCVLTGEVFLLEDGPLTESAGTLDFVDIGDGGLLVEIEEEIDSDNVLAVRWIITQVGNVSVWYIESPVMATMTGGAPATQDDAISVTRAMVDVVRGS